MIVGFNIVVTTVDAAHPQMPLGYLNEEVVSVTANPRLPTLNSLLHSVAENKAIS